VPGAVVAVFSAGDVASDGASLVAAELPPTGNIGAAGAVCAAEALGCGTADVAGADCAVASVARRVVLSAADSDIMTALTDTR